MSIEYDRYLANHKENVRKGFDWLKFHLPEIIKDDVGDDYEWNICFHHDDSKSESDEYHAYDAYFYGGNRSFSVVEEFNKAWLRHLHRNPHHWQYWILVMDDPGEPEKIIDMDYVYIIEMICDWWSFSWAKGDLFGIFDWYKEHQYHIKMSLDTRQTVESILEQIRVKLDELK